MVANKDIQNIGTPKTQQTRSHKPNSYKLKKQNSNNFKTGNRFEHGISSKKISR